MAARIVGKGGTFVLSIICGHRHIHLGFGDIDVEYSSHQTFLCRFFRYASGTPSVAGDPGDSSSSQRRLMIVSWLG